MVLAEWDNEGYKISTYDATTGEKIRENTDLHYSFWFSTFDASTGIIYLYADNGPDDKGMYKYDPSNDTITVIWDRFSHHDGNGGGSADEPEDTTE